MAGALIVSGPLDEVPEVAAATEQVLVLQRIQNGPAMIARMSSMHDNRFLSLSGNPAFTTNCRILTAPYNSRGPFLWFLFSFIPTRPAGQPRTR